MYRQIILHPDDRCFQRVFWYSDGKIKVFELNTVIFGISSASFLVNRTIHKFANDESVSFPHASKVLERDLYVDNLLTGAHALAEILKIHDEVMKLLRCGGLDIPQWASNHHYALDNIEERIFVLDCAIEESPVLKTLDIVWDTRRDEVTN